MGSMPRANAPANRWIALLGRGEATADGIQDYCRYLARSIDRQGVKLALVRVDWDGKGWWAALRDLRKESKAWPGQWVLLQFSALAGGGGGGLFFFFFFLFVFFFSLS